MNPELMNQMIQAMLMGKPEMIPQMAGQQGTPQGGMLAPMQQMAALLGTVNSPMAEAPTPSTYVIQPDSPRTMNPQFSASVMQALMGQPMQSPSLGALLGGR